jgi:hypothetical protein
MSKTTIVLSCVVLFSLGVNAHAAGLEDTTDDGTGTISARGDNPPNETMYEAFDNLTGTKWLDFSPTYSWIQYQYAGSTTFVVTEYTLTSANDYPARDPMDWNILGSNDNGSTWDTLDARTGELFTARFQTRSFQFANSTAYNIYRLEITQVRDLGGANSTQLAEIELLAYLDTTIAHNPSPANGAVDVLTDATLSWTAGSEAASHDVYFDTTYPPAFIDNQTETTFDPGVLEFNTAYYWRIDEVNEPNTITGDLWTFTTASGLAYDPDPVNGAINVARDKILSWTAGSGAVSHDVYLGTDAAGVGAAERLTGDLDGSGTVDYNDLFILTDCWAQDPFGSEPYAGVNDDDIVDFTDYTLQAENYMGQPSPWFKGNTSATSYDYDDPCDFELDTTYYWRVDEVNGPVKLKGDLWSFTTTASDSNYSLVGKVMCGYQGWFNCPGDGTPRGWVHWGSGGFTPSNCTVDMWPDMTEMGPGEKFHATAFDDANGAHYVFSSHNYDTVVRHFQWMSDYGIDGVYLQRFATETTPGSAAFYHRNDVLSYCKAGANLYGKKYAVMYDLSGLGSGDIPKVVNDWKYLVDTMQVGKDPADMGYMTHNGQPVVAIWGLGFGRSYEGSATRDLIDFLKNDPTYGGNVVMIGVNDNWRTNSDGYFQQTLQLADIISPWWVGRFGNTSEVYSWASGTGVPDKAWCDSNGKEYLPVLFPGFSWYNLKGGTFNHIPREGGQFLWDQVYSHINTVGAAMLYIAMFDEVDEATAIFKVTNDPPVVPPAQFVTYDIDGYPLPSDEYLWLVGEATRALRGEIPANVTRPAR